MTTHCWKGLLPLAVSAMLALPAAGPVAAEDMIVKKQVLELPTFTTQRGRTIRNVKIGWESYGTLNPDRSNAILICHSFSGNSHAAGKYASSDAAPGYWDDIIGPGKAIDTNKYFVISADTLVNLSAHDRNVVTTGPASINPDTGKPYGSTFPVVTIGDFVEVQKKLVESLGISRLVMVGGAAMGAMQVYEWGATYPHMVGKIMPVIGSGYSDANLVGWFDLWGAPIRMDANWNQGDFYGKQPPTAGMIETIKFALLHAQHYEWANAMFSTPNGVKWAKPGEHPGASLGSQFAVVQTLAGLAAGKAKVADANHLLYLLKAKQLFHGADARARLGRIKAPTLLVYSPKDQLYPEEFMLMTAGLIQAGGTPVETFKLGGNRGHLDGVVSMKQTEHAIRRFLDGEAVSQEVLPEPRSRKAGGTRAPRRG